MQKKKTEETEKADVRLRVALPPPGTRDPQQQPPQPISWIAARHKHIHRNMPKGEKSANNSL
jgi:hypothetical protein